MIIEEAKPLAPLTTFRVGGPARLFAEAFADEDVGAAYREAKRRNVPLAVLGGGSNLLVPDGGVDGLVLRMASNGIRVRDEKDDVAEVVAEAGTPWDEIVRFAGMRGWFGIENLAGIPGTLGGAIVQNIGAYGTELSESVSWVDAIDIGEGEPVRIQNERAAFAYRDSLFKKKPELVIVRAALVFSKKGTPRLSYPDLEIAFREGAPLRTPVEIADAVRRIRGTKFPDLNVLGTAGSFFKNPVVSAEAALKLREKVPAARQFPRPDGRVKIALASVLDHALRMNGFRNGRARLFERQPLVIAAERGATAAEIDFLAQDVARRVYEATGIPIEREVETFGERKFF